MNLDSNLKIEIISLLLGQEIKPYDEKIQGKTEDILSVDDFHLHNLIGKRQANVRKPLIDEEDFFDPGHDCDFTYLSDSAKCTRGDELYKRPKGWYRIALKVKGKYPDGDTWLGPKGWRSHSAPGEWPVSYHGTSLKGAKGIIRSHYKAGNGDVYGRGIYSTPDIHVAEREEYAQTFTSKTTGKSYQVILQNRINPKKREICERFDYWLIRVKEGTSAEEERKIVENSLRPYGILIKELNDDDEEDEADDNGDLVDDDNEDNDGDNDCRYDDGCFIDSYDDDNGYGDGDHDDDDNECHSDECNDDDEYEDGHDCEVEDDDIRNDLGDVADDYNEDDVGDDDDEDDDDDGNVNDNCDDEDAVESDDCEDDEDCEDDICDDEDAVESDDCEDDEDCEDDTGDDEDAVENDDCEADEDREDDEDCEDDIGDDEDAVENDDCEDDEDCEDDDGDDDGNEHYDDDDDNSNYDEDNVDDICNDDGYDDYDDFDGSGCDDYDDD